MDSSIINLISSILHRLYALEDHIAPLLRDWIGLISSTIDTLNPIQRKTYLISTIADIDQPDTLVQSFLTILKELQDSEVYEAPRINEQNALVIIADKIIQIHFSAQQSSEDLTHAFLSLITESRIAKAKHFAINQLLSKNEAPLAEHRLQQIEEGAASSTKRQSQRERGLGKEGYTADRQALMQYYLLGALGVENEYIDMAAVANLLHVLSGYAPIGPNGKLNIDYSSLYGAVKRILSSKDKKLLGDLHFILDALRPLETIPAYGFHVAIKKVEDEIKSVQATLEKKDRNKK